MSTRRNFIKKSVYGSLFFTRGIKWPAVFLSKGEKNNEKIRIIIETDAGGDPDDEQSLVRFLLYSNVFDIEGIIANRPEARQGENKNSVRDGLGIVKAMINAYGECQPSLAIHDRNYPEAGLLLERTVPGYNDTAEGVDLIIRAVDSNDQRPVWFCNWGTDDGSAESCMKRALDQVLRERGQKGYAKFKSRIRLSSADKFGEHTTTLEPPFPFWIDTWRPPVDGKRWYHRFSPVAYKAGGFDIEKDVRTEHGPLGELYPLNTNYPQKEGDTMSFLYLVPTGMNDPSNPLWGSWAGRYGLNDEHKGKNYYWANQQDAWNGTTSRDNMLARWAEAFQNDFKARMDWCVRTYKEANHHPVPVVNELSGTGIIHIRTRPGNIIRLNAGQSYDPDRRKLIPRWFIYPEAGTFRKTVTLKDPDTLTTSFISPAVGKTETIHIILELKNDGEPPLFSYRRIIVTVSPIKNVKLS